MFNCLIATCSALTCGQTDDAV